EVAVWDVVDEAVGERVVQRAVLAERLPVVAALDAVQHGEAADVGAVEQVAARVEVEAPGVAAALAEQLELPRDRVVAPDALLEFHAVDVGGHGAALAAVQPAVRKFCQACDSVRTGKDSICTVQRCPGRRRGGGRLPSLPVTLPPSGSVGKSPLPTE